MPGAVRTSVVIPALRAWETLPRVLDALAGQVDASHEVIVVDSSADGGAEQLGRRWPWVRVIALPRRTLPGAARNIGALHASGQWLAFCDADAIPMPDWLATLEEAAAAGAAAVAGTILNGTPTSAVGTAGWLLEFSEWLPDRCGPLLHGASANLLVRRSAFDRHGGMPEDVWPGEDTILTFRLAASEGLEFASTAAVRHLNRTGGRAFLEHQRRLGASFVQVCAQVDLPYRWVGRPPAAVLAGPLRLLALARRLARSPSDGRMALRVAPLLLAGLVAWTWGLSKPGDPLPPAQPEVHRPGP